VHARIPGEPQRKGDRGKRAAAEFQRAVVDRMGQRSPFRGPIALDLHFVALRKNPPSIYQLAKYALDVLGTAEPENIRPRRRSVLYYDDRQVKFLYVDLDQRWGRKPQVEFDLNLGIDQSFREIPSEPTPTSFMVARPARDAMADLATAYSLRSRRDNSFPDLACYDLPSLDSSLKGTDPFNYPEAPEDVDLRLRPRFSSANEELSAFLDEAKRFEAGLCCRIRRPRSQTVPGEPALESVLGPVTG
jgi:hypothetical protein